MRCKRHRKDFRRATLPNQLGGLRDYCKLPKQGPGQSPRSKYIFDYNTKNNNFYFFNIFSYRISNIYRDLIYKTCLQLMYLSAVSLIK